MTRDKNIKINKIINSKQVYILSILNLFLEKASVKEDQSGTFKN